MVVAVVAALIGGLAAIIAALVGVFAASGNTPPKLVPPSELSVERVTRQPQGELSGELIIVEGTAHDLHTGYQVYAVARPAVAHSEAATPSGAKAPVRPTATRWLVSRGVVPRKDGRWRAEIYVEVPRTAVYSYEATEMPPAVEYPGCDGCIPARIDRSQQALEAHGSRAARVVSEPFTPRGQ